MKTIYYRLCGFISTWMMRLLPRKTPVVFNGPDSSVSMINQLSVLGLNNVLVVTDKVLHSNGVLDRMLETLDRSGVAVSVFDDVSPNPYFKDVIAAESLFRQNGCQAVVAVGGGSVLDSAKMIALLHTNPGSLDRFEGVQKAKNAAVPLLVAPTTAGTGSEMTAVAVISEQGSGRKLFVTDTKLLPDVIALDAKLMQSMPPGITASTGMDALTHAVESYLNKSSTQETEMQAVAATRLIFQNLSQAFHKGDDIEARSNMALASFYAGASFGRALVGYVHAIAHELGRVCGTPHGYANAMVLPEVLRAYGPVVYPRLAQLARRAGIGDASQPDAGLAIAFIDAIIALRAEMQMPLKPQGLNRHQIPEMAQAAVKEVGELYPVPRYLSLAEVDVIISALLEG